MSNRVHAKESIFKSIGYFIIILIEKKTNLSINSINLQIQLKIVIIFICCARMVLAFECIPYIQLDNPDKKLEKQNKKKFKMDDEIHTNNIYCLQNK